MGIPWPIELIPLLLPRDQFEHVINELVSADLH
jgi:hypothetical protein